MNDLIRLLPDFWEAAAETLYIVALSLLFGGILGLVLGVAVYATRSGGLFANRAASAILGVIINTFRPIPFIIFLAAAQPLARLVVGKGIGINAVIFTIALAASFAIARLVEQNLLTVQPGVIEAARAMGASRWRTLLTIVVPEALGPLVLSGTFVVIALVDMSAQAGLIGGGGLGYFAIQYGYLQFNPWVTWAALVLLIVFVQVIQYLGNLLARRILRR
ncbi:methionine ABC transporter permease [Homoserinibacter sp. YIM 151385]|uniref:methionine ABC transporter permease n=1 Tax=Homoserinibacter sp. YIM 151385 TaxID=2985506 RepID=UPI0022F07F20|nr:methionine ABC transporter permease [Homoserinibacter sp. YIM 151385]WBU37993.1 ABC transporter permease [Homoserinibacter sp. YIM 151385]